MTNHPNRSKIDAEQYPFGDKYLVSAKYPARRLLARLAMERQDFARRQAGLASDVHRQAALRNDKKLMNVALAALNEANLAITEAGDANSRAMNLNF